MTISIIEVIGYLILINILGLIGGSILKRCNTSDEIQSTYKLIQSYEKVVLVVYIILCLNCDLALVLESFGVKFAL